MLGLFDVLEVYMGTARTRKGVAARVAGLLVLALIAVLFVLTIMALW